MYTIHTMKRTNIHLPDKQLELLKRLSDNTDLSVAEHIRRAIDEYLEKQKDSNDEQVWDM